MFHDAPDIPHYAKVSIVSQNSPDDKYIFVQNKAVGTMKPGMVFTIEPVSNGT